MTKEELDVFNEFKEEQCKLNPDFKRIFDIMESFKTNEVLVEYTKHSPPPSIHDKAIEVYKKSISFRVKLTKKILSHLRYNPSTQDIWYHSVPYCIDEEKVKFFLNEYQSWNQKIYSLWNEIYYLKEDFFNNSGYKNDWKFYVKHPNILKSKGDEIEKLRDKILTLINAGKELVLKHDQAVTLESPYNNVYKT